MRRLAGLLIKAPIYGGVGALVGIVFAGVYWWFKLFMSPESETPTEFLVKACATLGLLAAVKSTFDEARHDRRTAQQAEKAAVRAEEEAREAERGRIEWTLSQMSSDAAAAVEAYARLPEHLSYAQAHHGNAISHQTAPAYSLFWQSIEDAYQCLGAYHAELQNIRAHAASFDEHARRLPVGTVAQPFPITVNDVEATGAAETVEAGLRVVVDQAHRDFHFASIYEQRRTTSSVVAGFQGLQGAIHGMRGVLTGALVGLRTELQSGHRSLGRIIQEESRSSTGQLWDARHPVNERHRQMIAQVTACGAELRKLSQGR